MTTAQVVETSVTVNNNSPNQDYVHPDHQTQPTFEMTPWFKPFRVTQIVIFKTFTQLNRDCHWLILGHVALTKIKRIAIVMR